MGIKSSKRTLTLFTVADIGLCATSYDIHKYLVSNPKYWTNSTKIFKPTTDGKIKYTSATEQMLDHLYKTQRKQHEEEGFGFRGYLIIPKKATAMVSKLTDLDLLQYEKGNNYGHMIYPYSTVKTIIKYYLGIGLEDISNSGESFLINVLTELKGKRTPNNFGNVGFSARTVVPKTEQVETSAPETSVINRCSKGERINQTYINCGKLLKVSKEHTADIIKEYNSRKGSDKRKQVAIWANHELGVSKPKALKIMDYYSNLCKGKINNEETPCP
jgi:hypothetical protein